MLIWIFGDVRESEVHLSQNNKASGLLRLERANVRWFLSIDYNDLFLISKKNGQRTYRSIIIDNQEIEFSEGFTDLHTRSYQELLAGRGFGLEDARKSIEAVYTIRNSIPVVPGTDYHPLLKMLH